RTDWTNPPRTLGNYSSGQTDAKITQTPSLVLERGQTAYLRCQQTYGHDSMFWYRQDPGQGLQLLFYFYYKEEREKGTNSSHFQADQPQNDVFRLNISSVQPDNIKDGFTASRPKIEVFDMNITSVKIEHSAVYFCASSLDTVLQSHLLPLQKPPSSPHAPSERAAPPIST
uniref:Ig-like domain-containing protein n=1 Tax=Chelydra serpentina TaxID=8475 RepID=A0A8C3SML8_CHESE